MRPKRSKLWAVAIVFCLASSLLTSKRAFVAAGQSADTDAAARLRQRGLSPLGNTWICAAEVRLRAALAGFEALEKRYRAAEKRAAAALAQNERIRAQLVQLEAAGKAGQTPAPASSTNSSSSGSTTSKPATPNAKRPSAKEPDVTGVGDQTPLQRAMVALANARVALLRAGAMAESDLASLEATYKTVGGDAAVSAGLKQVGGVLGPAKDYSRQVRAVQEAVRSIPAEHAPVFRESGRYRLSGLVGEATLATFSLVGAGEPTTITSATAQAAEVVPTPGTPARTVSLRGRQVRCAAAELPRITLGAAGAEKLTVLVLPPEAEDLGSQLAADALPGWKLVLDERAMRVRFERKGQ
jgi:hypothetical protein